MGWDGSGMGVQMKTSLEFHVAQAGLELTLILLSQPPLGWDYKCEPSHPAPAFWMLVGRDQVISDN